MKPIALIALPLLFATEPALAGNSELSLAALVGAHSPHLTAAEKTLLENSGLTRNRTTLKAVIATSPVVLAAAHVAPED